MIHIAWPWIALLLPLPWLAYRLRRAAQSSGVALYFPFAANVVDESTNAHATNRLARVLFALLWLLLILAAMRPQWLGDPLPVPTTGRRLLLAVDVSGSMATEDMANNASRLQVVQQVAGNFIDGRHGDQVGLILFGTQPYLQAPLTADLTTVHRFLNESMVGVAGQETAIGDAIGLAIKRLQAEDSVPNQTSQIHRNAKTVLILLTDGQSNAGEMDPLQAAQMAKQTGLRIYTIGVGGEPQEGFFGLSGGSDLDEDTLKAIAKTTGGEYFRATDVNALEAVYKKIDALEPAEGHRQWLRPADEWFAWPLGLALLLSVPAVLMGARRWAA